MPPFPTITLGPDYVKTRFLEPSLPEAMAQRHFGMPRGVYLGYTPYAGMGSDILLLLRDVNHGFSILKVGSKSNNAHVDIFTDEDVALDFTGHTIWPVYVLATSNYTSDRATSGTIFTRATKAVGLDEVLICKVNKTGVDLVIESDIPVNRQPPLAFSGQRFGFMGQNAIGELTTASTVAAEVIAARTSIYTGVHTTLRDRIDDDVSGTTIAAKLGLVLHNIVGNVYSGVTGSSWNVSGSFSEKSRQFEPKITFEPDATEISVGAITAPGDSVRNIAFLIDELTGSRIVDETNPSVASPALTPIYGRIVYFSGPSGGGKQIHYTPNVDDITGNGTNPFVAPLQQGDLLLAPDGKFYELETIIGPDDAVLGSAYQGPTPGFVDDSTYRRFTLSFFNTAGAYSIPTAKTIRLSFPAFIRLDQSIFDGLLYMRKSAELPVIESATTAVAGKVLQATAGAKAGTVSAENNTAPLGPNFHTLNFATGGATDAGFGVANVTVPGATGPPGVDADVGPDGPPGGAGAGYTQSVPFIKSGLYSTPLVSISFTNDFAVSHGFPSLAAVTAGWAQFHLGTGFSTTEISNITKVSTVGGITFSSDVTGPVDFAFFLGGCR